MLQNKQKLKLQTSSVSLNTWAAAAYFCAAIAMPTLISIVCLGWLVDDAAEMNTVLIFLVLLRVWLTFKVTLSGARVLGVEGVYERQVKVLRRCCHGGMQSGINIHGGRCWLSCQQFNSSSSLPWNLINVLADWGNLCALISHHGPGCETATE